MAEPYAELLSDLADEQHALDAVVSPLPADAWDAPTPADGWAVRDQVWHLCYFDGQATVAAIDPDGFTAGRAAAMADPVAWEAEMVARGREVAPPDLLDRWRAGRAELLRALAGLEQGRRLPWYGPPMSAMSFATARLMETWAHGQDVVDGLATAGHRPELPATDRLRHIGHLGVRTRGFSYAVRAREAPTDEVRVELTAPSGDEWTWGDASASDRVRGPAVDFCLVVTQRRNVVDTALDVTGQAATEWMAIAQCFAGGPGAGRPPSGR